MRGGTWVLAASCLALGAAVGAAWSAHQNASRATTAAAAITRRLDALEAAEDSARTATAASLAQIDAQLRDLVVASREQVPGGSPAVAPAPPPLPTATAPAADPESAAAYDGAKQLLVDATARGRWSDEDRRQLRALVVQMAPPEREEVARALARRINTRELVMDGMGPPL